MRNLVLLIVTYFSFLGMSCQPKETFKSVDVDEFKKVISDTSYVVLDVRTSKEYAEGHIPGTQFNIDILQNDFVEESLKKLPKEKSVALYCRSGNRSKKAARILSENGYRVIELSTGYKGWISAENLSE